MELKDEELTYAHLLQLLRRSRRMVIALVVLGLAAGIGLGFLIQPVYRAEVLLASAASDDVQGSALGRLAGQFGALSGLLGSGSAEGLQSKEVKVATLQSKQLTAQFIAERQLMPELFASRWDKSTQNWKQSGSRKTPSLNEAVKHFDRDIRSLGEDRKSGLVTLAIEWRDPDVAAQWANELVERVNEFMRTRAIDEARKSISFLEAELAKTNVVERQQIIYRLIESKTSEIMLANARKDFAFIVVDPARPPEINEPVWPPRALFAALGLALGFGVGCAIALIKGRRSRYAQDVR